MGAPFLMLVVVISCGATLMKRIPEATTLARRWCSSQYMEDLGVAPIQEATSLVCTHMYSDTHYVCVGYNSSSDIHLLLAY
jgi:hypothetical protein